jgi:hypothetical protein
LNSQIFYLSLFIFAFAFIGAFYPYNRGGMYTALIIMYALTASIAGYVASSYYKQMEGELWVRNILLTCFVYCGPFFLTWSILNTVAIAYRVRIPSGDGFCRDEGGICKAIGETKSIRDKVMLPYACPLPFPSFSHPTVLIHPHAPSLPQSTAALPFSTIVIIILIWCAITIPLTIFGGIAGKNNKSEFLAPCRTNKYPRCASHAR